MIGFIVDGQSDWAAFRVRFPENARVLKSDGPRGHTADTEAIASSACKQISMLSALGCDAIGIITDLEGRTVSCKKFVADLQNCVNRHNANVPVFVAASDQMIENWFLADVEQLSKKKVFIKDRARQKNFEGMHGKKVLKSYFKPGYSYNEVRDAPHLFKVIRVTVAARNSPSFKAFVVEVRKRGGRMT